MMTMEEIRQEIQKQVKAAYRLLPLNINPTWPNRTRNDLAEKYEEQEWRQLLYLLQEHSRINKFSDQLLFHLQAADELLPLFDQLGMRAALEQLTEEEKHIIGECLHAAAHGPFFLDDWEFPTIFGATHEEAVEVAEAWPNVEETDETAKMVINNSINNLFGYPHGKHNQWSRYISASPRRVKEVFTKFRVLTGMLDNQKAEDSEYFRNMM